MSKHQCISNSIRSILPAAIVLSASITGCSDDEVLEVIDERSLEGAVVTHCGEGTWIDEDGNTHTSPIAYYFDHMNNQLDSDPGLRAHVGLKRVSTCAEAEQFALTQPAYEEIHRPDETAYLPEVKSLPGSDDQNFRIYYGAVVQKPGVVRINNSCSGVFITSRHILTAAHCFDSIGGGAQSIAIFEQNGSGGHSATRTGFVHIHPDYTGSSSSTDVNDDLALISLWSDVPWTPTPHRFYKGTTHLNTQLHIYGYGHNVDGGGGFGTLREGNNNTPINLNYHTGGYFRATAHTARICKGDSGGPAIDESATFPITWGVASQAAFSNKCTKYEGAMRWTKTNVKANWIAAKLLENHDGDFSCTSYTYSAGSYFRCF